MMQTNRKQGSRSASGSRSARRSLWALVQPPGQPAGPRTLSPIQDTFPGPKSSLRGSQARTGILTLSLGSRAHP